MTNPHAICHKWVAVLGTGFNPDTSGDDYTPELSPEEIKDYEADMDALCNVAANPYECAVMAMADAGFNTGWFRPQ